MLEQILFAKVCTFGGFAPMPVEEPVLFAGGPWLSNGKAGCIKA